MHVELSADQIETIRQLLRREIGKQWRAVSTAAAIDAHNQIVSAAIKAEGENT